MYVEIIWQFQSHTCNIMSKKSSFKIKVFKLNKRFTKKTKIPIIFFLNIWSISCTFYCISVWIHLKLKYFINSNIRWNIIKFKDRHQIENICNKIWQLTATYFISFKTVLIRIYNVHIIVGWRPGTSCKFDNYEPAWLRVAKCLRSVVPTTVEQGRVKRTLESEIYFGLILNMPF